MERIKLTSKTMKTKIEIINKTEINVTKYGFVALVGCCIMTSDYAINDQMNWDSDDAGKKFDFTAYPFWLKIFGHNNTVDVITGYDTIDQIMAKYFSVFTWY